MGDDGDHSLERAERCVHAGAGDTHIPAGVNLYVWGGNTATFSCEFGCAFGGRPAWSGLSRGTTAVPLYMASVIDMPPAARGQSVRLKWRAATDDGTAADGAPGVRIDSITVGRYVCVACNAPFTDTPLVAGVTPIKAAHIQELRTHVNAVRALRGLAPFDFTDPTLTAGVTVLRAIHISELRTALNEAYMAASLPPPDYTDATLSAGATVTVVHIAELRAAVMAIE